jgi:hypothetical protein
VHAVHGLDRRSAADLDADGLHAPEPSRAPGKAGRPAGSGPPGRVG